MPVDFFPCLYKKTVSFISEQERSSDHDRKTNATGRARDQDK